MADESDLVVNVDAERALGFLVVDQGDRFGRQRTVMGPHQVATLERGLQEHPVSLSAGVVFGDITKGTPVFGRLKLGGGRAFQVIRAGSP